MIKIDLLSGMEVKAMSKRELEVLEAYCVENCWTASDLIVVVGNSIEPADLAGKKVPCNGDRKPLLQLLLDEYGTVDRVIALLPAMGQDF